MIAIDKAELQAQIDDAISSFKKLSKDIPVKIQEGLGKAGAVVTATAKRNLRDGGHVITGRLLNSITYTVEDVGDGQYACYVGTNVFYGKWLEFGTSKMPEYAFLRPAINSERARVRKLIEKAVFDYIDSLSK